ncbi:MAG: UDP-N-acetylmuramate--L-alanine ligase [Myxococcales bacterium]|nr:UDP-N-acetylmuramate--L-alanine ligase [Myxococcales bacterium]
MSESPRRVHFVAIGGTGMGSLAGLLHARGIEVTGSDECLYPPMSTALDRWGIPAFEGFAAEHVLENPPDLVVIGNAVGPENPEARAAIDEGLAYLSFPDALYQYAIAGRHPVVISGTHGKTTTTSLVAALLLRTGRDPSLLVGGFPLDFDTSFREGEGDYFVVEGDEYDTAFFDKTPKFLHYGARTLLITSVEFDHADIYRDLDHVKQAFRDLVAALPPDGALVAAVDHAEVRDVVAGAPCRSVGYGIETDAEGAWRAARLEVEPEGTSFDVIRDGRTLLRAHVPLFGDFNVENALGALVIANELGVPLDAAAAALARFRGVKRRQELRGEARGVVVVDDFAHHPTAVRAGIGAVRARFPGRRLIAVFEPRTNTSRRAIFQADYARSFDGADRVVVRIVPDEPIYSATGPVTQRFSSERLADDLRSRGVAAVALDGVDAIVAHLVRDCEAGDVVLVMSNGAFENIWERLLEALSSDPSA